MSAITKIVTVGGVIGVSSLFSWFLMKALTPSREEMLKVLPEKNPEIMAASQKRSQEFLNVIEAAAKTHTPVYRDGIGVLTDLKKD